MPHATAAQRNVILLFCLLLLPGSVAFLAGAVNREIDGFERRVRVDVQRQSQAGLAASMEMVRRSLDHVTTLHALGGMMHLTGRRENGIQFERLAQHLREVAYTRMAGVLQVAIIDQDGRLSWSTVHGFEPIDLSDREHFQVHVQGRTAPFVSAPLVGRASGRPSLQLTRPIIDMTGAFRGVVVVSLDPVEVSRALGRNNPLSDGAITVIRHDGVVLARSTDTEAMIGRVVSPQPLAVLTSAQRGGVEMASSLSGDERFIAWQQLDEWPLILAYSVPLEPGRREVAQHREEILGNALVGSVVVVFGVGCVVLYASRRNAAALAREALRSRRHLEDLVAALPGAAYRLILGVNGRVCRVQSGPVLRRITGLDEGEDWGRLAEEPDVRARLFQQVATAGQGSAEYRIVRGDGTALYVRDEARHFQTRDDGCVEIVGMLSDVTGEREMRAQAITGAKLATLGEMATGIAHEMNQPAAAITLAADVVELELRQAGASVPAATLDRVAQIADQATRIRDIIDHIRLFGRRDAAELPPVPVPVAAMIEGALSLTRGSLKAAGVTLHTEMEEGLPDVMGQRVALEQVIVNLVLNARDAVEENPDGIREIHLRAMASPEAGKVLVTVEDSGNGFGPDALGRAFEPFFTSKPPGKGTGLGLPIAYSTLQRFGGSIRLSNRGQGGARVEVQLAAAGTAGMGAAA